MRRRSNSPPPPPIAAPLLEMGFTLRHILKAIFETKSSGEISAHTINMLATWMIEHPLLDPCAEEDNPGPTTSTLEDCMNISNFEGIRSMVKNVDLSDIVRQVSYNYLQKSLIGFIIFSWD